MGLLDRIKEAAAKVAAAAKAKLEAAKKLAIETARKLAKKAAAAAKAVADAAKKALDLARRVKAAEKAAKTAAKKKALEAAKKIAAAAAKKVADAAKKVKDAIATAKEAADEKEKQAEEEAAIAEKEADRIEEAETIEEVKQTWWDRFKEGIRDNLKLVQLGTSAAFGSIYQLVTGKVYGEAEYEKTKDFIEDWIFPLDSLSKLFTGKNLKDEPEEFGSADDWINTLLLFAAIIPVGKVAGTGAKLAISKISTKEAAKLTAQLGKKTIIADLIKRVSRHPETSARFLSKFPIAVREAVLFGLSKTPTGRIALVTLGKTGYYKYIAKGWPKLIRGILKFGIISAVIFLPIFAIAEIPNYFNMRIFARKAIAQQEGEYAPDFSFQLNEFESSLEKITWELKENIEAKQYDTARANLDALEAIVNNYENYINEKKDIMFTEDYDLSVELIEFYRRLIQTRRELIGAPPVETTEEMWARIDAENEEDRLRIIKEDEERYARVHEEEAERRAAEIKANEERWARYREEAKVVEEEKLIAAEEHWAKIREIEAAIVAEERAYWEARLVGPKKATITITSEPTNSDVYIDGEYTFTKTPYTVLLDAGSYYFRVQKEGYYPKEIIAEIEEGEVSEVPITLEIVPPDAPPQPPYIPYQPTYPSGYETLYPTVQAPIFYPEPAAPLEKELLINIETTDVYPWKGRIYSIAVQDLSMPELAPVVLTDDDEENLINEFLNLFNQLNPKKLIGFKLTFDHRFIFAKMMLYRLQSEKFKNIEMLDVKQIMDQVQEKFVYFPSKVGTLDDWGKMLLGKGKYGSQELMLRKYLAGDFEYVKAFQERQMEITKGLYDLSRFSGSELLTSPISSIPETTSNPIPSLSPTSAETPGQKQCKNCLAFNPIDAKVCIVCGQEF